MVLADLLAGCLAELIALCFILLARSACLDVFIQIIANGDPRCLFYDGWWDTYGIHRGMDYSMLCEYASYGGNLSVLEYLLMHDDNNMHPELRLLKQRCEPGGIGLSVFVSAAAGGHLKCLEFLLSDLNRIVRYSKKVKYYSAIFLQYLLNISARFGHINVMTWVLQHVETHYSEEDNVGIETTVAAAIGGHLHVLEWIFSNPSYLVYFTDTVSVAAAGEGHIEVLSWLHGKRLPINWVKCRCIIIERYFDKLENSIFWNHVDGDHAKEIVSAIRANDSWNLQNLVKVAGVALEPMYLEIALLHNQYGMFHDLIVHYKCPIDDNVYFAAFMLTNREIREPIVRNMMMIGVGKPFSESTLLNSASFFHSYHYMCLVTMGCRQNVVGVRNAAEKSAIEGCMLLKYCSKLYEAPVLVPYCVHNIKYSLRAFMANVLNYEDFVYE